jgi:hypothetical protein
MINYHVCWCQPAFAPIFYVLLQRALFGNLGGECITTLAAWTVMCEEARSFGRALYDAEQVHLKLLQAHEFHFAFTNGHQRTQA